MSRARVDWKHQNTSQAQSFGNAFEKNRTRPATAEKIGATVASRANVKKITKVVFDRGGFLYHGKVKALADAARAGGVHAADARLRPVAAAARPPRPRINETDPINGCVY